MTALRLGIIGGGVGGRGDPARWPPPCSRITAYEQAGQFARVGADINLTANAVRALDGLGTDVGAAVRQRGARQTFRISRDWDTGKETSRLGMSDVVEEEFGAPQITIHRSDVLAASTEAHDAPQVSFGKHLTTLRGTEAGVELQFDDDSSDTVDVTIGADGIHSRVRSALFGEESPRFTGVVSFRSVMPTERVKDVPEIEASTQWWGPNPQSQIVTFPLNQGRDTFVFATTGQDSWHEESWTSPVDVNELRSFYRDFHPDARKLLEACDETLKSALYEREPLPEWSRGHVTLLGDACHPMLPFMAQGACQVIEDANVLSRCLGPVADRVQAVDALLTYASARQERTVRIQIGSRGNQWMKTRGNAGIEVLGGSSQVLAELMKADNLRFGNLAGQLAIKAD